MRYGRLVRVKNMPALKAIEIVKAVRSPYFDQVYMLDKDGNVYGNHTQSHGWTKTICTGSSEFSRCMVALGVVPKKEWDAMKEEDEVRNAAIKKRGQISEVKKLMAKLGVNLTKAQERKLK